MTALGSIGNMAARAHNTSIASSARLMLVGSSLTLAALVVYLIQQGKLFQKDDPAQQSDTNFSNMGVNPAVLARMKTVYKYVFGGLAITAGTAALAHSSGLSRIILQSGMARLGIFAASIASLVVTMWSKANSPTQVKAWVVFTASMGLGTCTLGFLGGAILGQAAAITLGLGSILSYVAYNAKDKTFLQYEGTLLSGLTALTIVSFIASFFREKAASFGIDRLSLYIGIAIYCGLFMASTQQILDKSQKSVDDSEKLENFNAINHSLSLYLDTMNLFVKIAIALAKSKEDENKRKRDEHPV